jgi:hypothetical protein
MERGVKGMLPLGCLPAGGERPPPSYPLQNVKKIRAAKGFLQSNNFNNCSPALFRNKISIV